MLPQNSWSYWFCHRKTEPGVVQQSNLTSTWTWIPGKSLKVNRTTTVFVSESLTCYLICLRIQMWTQMKPRSTWAQTLRVCVCVCGDDRGSRCTLSLPPFSQTALMKGSGTVLNRARSLTLAQKNPRRDHLRGSRATSTRRLIGWIFQKVSANWRDRN